MTVALLGVVALLASASLGATTQAASTARLRASRLDAAAIPERELRRLLRSALLPTDSGGLRGTSRAMAWSSWCDVPAGWQERCVVRLVLTLDSAGPRATLSVPHLATPGELALRGPGRLRYLVARGGKGEWADAWTSPYALPLAVALETDSETLVVRVGRAQ